MFTRPDFVRLPRYSSRQGGERDMRVVVAEKPSVARDLARVLGATRRGEGFLEGSGLRITWCIGHLVELQEPAYYNPAWKRWSMDTLPMLPERFALKVRDGGRDQFDIVRRLLQARDVVDVVNACDAGREGELIFRYVAELAGLDKPVLRLWVSSLTDEAIRDGWSKLAPAQRFDRLADAARCRSEADWIVGLNATRALTLRGRDAGGSDLLSVGRVQTPTLAIIAARDRAIEQFVPETYWTVRGEFEVEPKEGQGPARPAPDEDLGALPEEEGEGRRFQATWFRPDLAKGEPADGKKPENDDESDGGAPNAERLSDKALAERIAQLTRGRTGKIELAERKRTTERPPPLYDLTSLQRRANQRYGLSAQRTLEVAQALYERHKLITYPRTDSRYLSPDQVPTLPALLRGLVPVPAYAPFAQQLLAGPLKPGPRVVNAAEVGDHPAITPTGKTPDPSLEPDEKRVYDLVARRFLAALMEDAVFDLTRIVVAVEPAEAVGELLQNAGIAAPLRFRARGRVCRHQGWRAADPPGKSAEIELPFTEVGDEAQALSAETLEGQTRPPRRYNDGSLLRSMEAAGKALDDEALARALRGRGLGTPATRAAILQTLLDRQYVERQGKELHSTPKGRALIDAIPVEALKSAELTAEWEGRLSEMADGRGPDAATFMAQVCRWTGEIVSALASATPSAALAATDAPSLGACPKCGAPVRERGRRYSCDGGAACGFVVYNTIAGRSISLRAVKQLLAEGRTPAMKGFKSKAGKEFVAGLCWNPGEGRVRLWFPEPGSEPPPEEPPEPARPSAAQASSSEEAPRRRRSRKDPAEAADSQPSERKPRERKPRERKPRERKPRERKPREPRSAEKARKPAAPKPPPTPLPPELAPQASLPSLNPKTPPPAPKETRSRRASARTAPAPRAAPPLQVGDRCPTCGEGRIIQGRAALGCNRWREGCNFRVG